MKIYVAAKYEEAPYVVTEIYDWLRDEGHKITHDWTGENDDKAKPGKLDEYHARCAADDIDGVLDAEVVVVLPHPDGKGLYAELGAALAMGIPVVVWNYNDAAKKVDCIFLKHPDIKHVVDSEKGVINAIAEIQHGTEERDYADVG